MRCVAIFFNLWCCIFSEEREADGRGGVLYYAWKEWGVQVLVLLSFILQVALLILAELRRRMDSGVLRAFVWSAYMLADATAIYVLGHMSVTVRLAEHKELMVFWAPLFLLLHLGPWWTGQHQRLCHRG